MSNSISWYEEDFTAFLLSLNLPAYRKDMIIIDVIKSEQEQFKSHFKEMIERDKHRGFSKRFYNSLDELLPKVEYVFQSLIDILGFYDSADLASAQNLFDKVMSSLRPYLFIQDIFWPYHPTTFYRVRVSPKEKLKEPKDLFHIPYKKRHLVSNERYSLAGHPCLYLASQLYIAWQECGYPYNYYCSEFQYQSAIDSEDDWKFITFLSPQDFASRFFVATNHSEDIYLKLAQSYILSYPLLFACSVVNLNGNSAFKQEYVIPQMLTQWVYRNYDGADGIKGIKYFSCYDADDLYKYNGFNVVMPAKNIDYRRGLSKDLIGKFKASKPKLLYTQLEEDKIALIKQYKQDLLGIRRDTFREASDCLLELYVLTDLLDKAIRNIDRSDVSFVLSAVRCVARDGKSLLEHHAKEHYLDSIIAAGRSSHKDSVQIEEKIDVFRKVYNRFQSEVLYVANEFDTITMRVPHHDNSEFTTV